jgi:hypothetical protein
MRFALNRGRDVRARGSAPKPIRGHDSEALLTEEVHAEFHGPHRECSVSEPQMEIRIGSAMGIRVVKRQAPTIVWRRPRKQLQPA